MLYDGDARDVPVKPISGKVHVRTQMEPHYAAYGAVFLEGVIPVQLCVDNVLIIIYEPSKTYVTKEASKRRGSWPTLSKLPVYQLSRRARDWSVSATYDLWRQSSE